MAVQFRSPAPQLRCPAMLRGRPLQNKTPPRNTAGRRFVFIQIYFTAIFNDFPALNFGTFVAAIFIFSPVLGLTPILAALLTTEKVPKPTNLTSSPLVRACVTASSKLATNSKIVFFEQPHLATILSTN